ncbi:MAG: hypothetical protein D6675_06335 [Gemmatimonadetes bacterium]|nr:MAG: hypothetical protein D6675_06335 [Gemmatimonadota bacterium]
MKKGIMLLSLLLTLMFLFPTSALALDKVAQSGVQFLKIGVGARAVGMGEAFVAVADDPTALYWNPAGLVNVEGKAFTVSYNKWIAETTHSFVGYAQYFPGLGTFGISFVNFSVGEIDETEPGIGLTGRTYGASDFMAGLSYSRRLTDKFSVGGTLKMINSYIADESAAGWAADVGTLYDTGFRTIRLGMVIQNFGGDIKYIGEDTPLPITFKAGVAMDLLNRDAHAVTGSIEMRHPNDNAETVQMGGEYWFNNMVATRLGYRYNYDAGGLTAGFGVRLDIGGSQFELDYSYTDMGEYLGPNFGDNPQRIGATLKF